MLRLERDAIVHERFLRRRAERREPFASALALHRDEGIRARATSLGKDKSSLTRSPVA